MKITWSETKSAWYIPSRLWSPFLPCLPTALPYHKHHWQLARHLVCYNTSSRTERWATTSSPLTDSLASRSLFPPCPARALLPSLPEHSQWSTATAPFPCCWCVSCLVTLIGGKKQAGLSTAAIYLHKWHPPLQSKFQAAVCATGESCNESVQRKTCQLFHVTNQTPWKLLAFPKGESIFLFLGDLSWTNH